VAADSIKIETDPVTSTSTTKLRSNFFKMDLQGNIVYQYTSGPSPFNIISNAINFDTQGNVYLVGSILRGGVNNKAAFVTKFIPTGSTYTLGWFQDFNLLASNYDNGRSLQITSTQNVIWPASLAKSRGTYAAFPFVESESIFNNSGSFGQRDDINNFTVNDLQPSALGFVAIGTQYTIATGNSPTGTNFFFVMLDKQGTVREESARYFDGGVDVTKNPAVSEVEDSGLALTKSGDGGFLLTGFFDSTPTRGNGGKDILIIKVDGFGNLEWTRSFGGSGDEVVNSALPTADGGYLLSGTSTVQNFASMFILKLSSTGELKE
jgi:hypothetical protein